MWYCGSVSLMGSVKEYIDDCIFGIGVESGWNGILEKLFRCQSAQKSVKDNIKEFIKIAKVLFLLLFFQCFCRFHYDVCIRMLYVIQIGIIYMFYVICW